jgi:hypothetical protein
MTPSLCVCVCVSAMPITPAGALDLTSKTALEAMTPLDKVGPCVWRPRSPPGWARTCCLVRARQRHVQACRRPLRASKTAHRGAARTHAGVHAAERQAVGRVSAARHPDERPLAPARAPAGQPVCVAAASALVGWQFVGRRLASSAARARSAAGLGLPALGGAAAAPTRRVPPPQLQRPSCSCAAAAARQNHTHSCGAARETALPLWLCAQRHTHTIHTAHTHTHTSHTSHHTGTRWRGSSW